VQVLFSELGKRISDRWVAQYLLPGLIWVAAAYAAVDPGRIVPRAEQLTRQFKDRPTAVVVVCLLVIAVAAVVSALARVLGMAIRVVWLGQWRGPARKLGELIARRRRRRKSARLEAANETLPAVYLPDRPTWIGDEVRMADARVYAQYGLYLALIWPRLWQLVDADTRTSVQDARERFDRSARLAGWAVVYGGLVVLWWPALFPALVFFGYTVFHGRSTVTLFTGTVESTVDLHNRALAESLGHVLEPGKPLSGRVADAINDQLHKGATPQKAHPVAATGSVVAEIE
jgi:hypothetical protein